jgi:hypothetical protein
MEDLKFPGGYEPTNEEEAQEDKWALMALAAGGFTQQELDELFVLGDEFADMSEDELATRFQQAFADRPYDQTRSLVLFMQEDTDDPDITDRQIEAFISLNNEQRATLMEVTLRIEDELAVRESEK